MLQHDDWLSYSSHSTHFNNAKLLSAIFPTIASYALAQRGLIPLAAATRKFSDVGRIA